MQAVKLGLVRLSLRAGTCDRQNYVMHRKIRRSDRNNISDDDLTAYRSITMLLGALPLACSVGANPDSGRVDELFFFSTF